MMTMTWIFVPLIFLLVAALFYLIVKQQKAGQGQESLSLMQKQIEAFREQLRSSLHDNSQQMREQMHHLKSEMTQKLEGSQLTLNQSQTQMNTRLDTAAKVIGSVQGKLGQLEEASRRIYDIGKDISSLEKILKAPKLRGNLGEFFLEELLAQVFSKENYEMQHRFASGEIVDAVIKLADYMVPVDSKFPLENFSKLVVCQDDSDKKALRRQFISDVKKHIDKIAQKYIRPDEGTADFALMYIPAENVYYELIIKSDLDAGEHGLYHYAAQKRVIPVSPNNLYIYVNTIIMGLKGMSVEKRAKEILASLSGLYQSFEKISETHGKLGKHIHNAHTSHEDVQKRLDRFLNKMEKVSGSESLLLDRTQH